MISLKEDMPDWPLKDPSSSLRFKIPSSNSEAVQVNFFIIPEISG